MLPSFRRREKTGDTVDKPFRLWSFSRRTSGSDRRRSMLVATRQQFTLTSQRRASYLCHACLTIPQTRTKLDEQLTSR